MILGSNSFKEKVLIQNLIDQKTKQDQLKKEIRSKITVEEIIESTARVFDVTTESITNKQKGKPKKNNPKALAMYLVQEIKDCSLTEIANVFNLNNSQSSGYSLVRIRKEIGEGYYKNELSEIKNKLGIINT